VGTLLSLPCLRRGVWGHSSRCLAFGGVSPSIIFGQPASDCMLLMGFSAPSTGTSLRSLPPHARLRSQTLSIVFFKAGKAILDPSMRTVHAIIGAPVAPSTGMSLRSLGFNKRKRRKRPDA